MRLDDTSHPSSLATPLLRVPPPKRLAVFASGGGSNAQALLQANRSGGLTAAKVVLVVTNRPTAGVLNVANEAGVATLVQPKQAFATPEAYDTALLEHLQAEGIEAIALAGWLRILSPVLVEAYAGCLTNIHPSLLPKFGGLGMYGHHVHEAVLNANEAWSGCTVHQVTAGVDEGAILAQQRVPVRLGDTPETLAQRVLAAEHQLYAPTLQTLYARQTSAHYNKNISKTIV
ncbi:MAG: phosphoribosylglycinamide formyltransferase [Vampirovibrionales bacterium]